MNKRQVTAGSYGYVTAGVNLRVTSRGPDSLPGTKERTMTTFEISNKTSGLLMGSYPAADEAGALEALAKDAGSASFAEACEVIGKTVEEARKDLIVRAID